MKAKKDIIANMETEVEIKLSEFVADYVNNP